MKEKYQLLRQHSEELREEVKKLAKDNKDLKI